jgi:transcription antitermination factor NusG
MEISTQPQPSMLGSNWYALQVRPRCECLVAALLTSKGYEIFAPVYKSARKWSDRTKEIEVHLFPGYVFCHFDPGVRSNSPVNTTPGVLKILGFANKPAPVDPKEMDAVRLAAQSKMSPKPFPYLASGLKIRIAHGPLSGLEGILARVKNKDVLVVSVAMLRRSIAVEIEKHLVELSDGTAPRDSLLSGTMDGTV